MSNYNLFIERLRWRFSWFNIRFQIWWFMTNLIPSKRKAYKAYEERVTAEIIENQNARCEHGLKYGECATCSSSLCEHGLDYFDCTYCAPF